jgi:hypothetical protein
MHVKLKGPIWNATITNPTKISAFKLIFADLSKTMKTCQECNMVYKVLQLLLATTHQRMTLQPPKSIQLLGITLGKGTRTLFIWKTKKCIF